MAEIIAVVGCPGSGKSTQAGRLADMHSWYLLSTGQLLRQHRGDLAANLASGDIVESAAAEAVWEKYIGSIIPPRQIVVMDSFPRRMVEAEWFMDRLGDWGRNIGRVIKLHVPEDEAVRRMLLRGRADDTEESLRRRWQLYETDSRPALELCDKLGLLAVVDGVGTEAAVAARLDEALKDF